MFDIFASLELSTVLGILGAIVGSGAVLYQFTYLRTKLKAEQKLEELFINNNVLSRRFLKAGSDFAEARKIVETLLKELPASEQQAISEGLHQPSEKGRSDYLKKLLRGALQD
jgi:hypothetical protein